MSQLDAVTGAFSYSGAAIARELQARGHRVLTLTGHPERAPAGTAVECRPLDFTDPAGLAASLAGADTLYNTYWVRFGRGQVSHEAAVANSRVLFEAAAKAGVRRVVHVSITHPSLSSPYSYFRGKAAAEQALAETGLPYAIARPAILFGGDGVLINNIAWLLRRLPVFAVGGRGEYRVRGIHVDDLARLCADLGAGDLGAADLGGADPGGAGPSAGPGAGADLGGTDLGGTDLGGADLGSADPGAGADNGSLVVDAVGPQSLTFREMVEAIRLAVGSRARVLHVPGKLIPVLAGALSVPLRDTLLTADEYRAMAAGLADSDSLATGRIVFTDWLGEHGAELGRRYANELDRHFRPAAATAR
jgi:uncharacterized protein YbjT (DUF2867 family)